MDFALFANTITITITGSRSFKTGIAACFAGGREETVQCAVYYYQMIGFDMFGFMKMNHGRMEKMYCP